MSERDDFFGQLLDTARRQPDAQRLLFVFAAAELPEDADEAQRQRFERGEGGALAPVMCVDKSPHELVDFPALADEARRMGPDWRVVFVAALGGHGAQPPDDATVDRALQQMVDAVKQGRVQGYLAFGDDGVPLRLG